MYCADCEKKWNGGVAPGIGPVCECGSDDFMSAKTKGRIDALKASGIEALRRAEVAEQQCDVYEDEVNVLVAENRLIYDTLQRVFSQYTALLRNCDRTQTVNDAIAVLRKAGMLI